MDSLSELIEHQNKMLITVGDWNAKVGNKTELSCVEKPGLGVRDEARKPLVEFQATTILLLLLLQIDGSGSCKCGGHLFPWEFST